MLLFINKKEKNKNVTGLLFSFSFYESLNYLFWGPLVVNVLITVINVVLTPNLTNKMWY